ncbi:hypothetical protein [Sphingomonas daechungensis]|uniref:hypothetical protein n=1 Tax=Sphingomonas daechungensis TaxID=1176646 RepID=UPI0037843988
MGGELENSASPLFGGPVTAQDRRLRFILLLAWVALAAWFCVNHVFWRDEVRAFSLALSGSNPLEMLGNVHGEGHPALWYIILRGLHDIFPYREVLPIAAALLGFAAMALVAFKAPFRPLVVALILFSLYGAFEFVAVARNYGMSAVVMFAIAALYPRLKNSLWLGLLIAILTNTNVPSGFLAASFLLFRFVEMVATRPVEKRDWLIFVGNALLAALGAYLCFRTIYPTFNDGAVSNRLGIFGPATLIPAIFELKSGFSGLGSILWPPLPLLLIGLSCLGLIRKPAALCAAIAGFIGFKYFFYFVYPSSYRHEALYLCFLIALYWMSAEGAGGSWSSKNPWVDRARIAGEYGFVALLALQTLQLMGPVSVEFGGLKYSRSADVGRLLQRPDLRNAIVMGDPDPFLEALPYYADNPLWFLRERKFGKVVRLNREGRQDLRLADVLADAELLHRQTGRPIVFLAPLPLKPRLAKKVMYESTTTVTPEDLERFKSQTRLIATFRPAVTDEAYDVYVYPR